MPYKLISLVFLLYFSIINKAYCENEFILPLKKPSIFKKIEKDLTVDKKLALPQQKPILKSTKPEPKIIKEEKEKKIKETLKKEMTKMRQWKKVTRKAKPIITVIVIIIDS